jgi:hypothetical protein
MRTFLTLGALMALTLAGCSSAADSLTGPDASRPSFSCRGESGNCGGGSGGNHNNNPNNPPATAP